MLETIEKYWWSEGHFNFDQRDYFIETLGKLNPKNVLEEALTLPPQVP